jgi:NAD(P)-dependent dehydrogenase (short-subunit alcohol dehydrogenase family)
MEDIKHPRAIRFSERDVDDFCRASGDWNPLHSSGLYARKTPFGEPVVHGALVVIRAVNEARLADAGRLSWLRAKFKHPVYRDTPYDVIEVHDDGKATLCICEGDREQARIDLGFERSAARRDCAFPSGPVFPRDVARRLDAEELSVGQRIAGPYNPDAAYHADLADRVQPRAAIGGLDLAALMACSYIAGMEMPGREALVRSFSLDFDGCDLPEAGSLRFSAEVTKLSRQIGLANIEVQLDLEDQPFAHGEIGSAVRPRHTATGQRVDRARRAGSSMRDRVVVVMGGSRGIGAALAQAFTWQGATVIAAFRECAEDARLVEESAADAPGALRLVQGDAADAQWCLNLEEEIVREHGRVDVLVCNACPSIREMQFSAAAVDRLNRYVAQSLALIDAPMAAFLETIGETGGLCVLMSSQALESKPAGWPHYVAAKAAAEALVELLAGLNDRVGFLTVRPPKTLTDQMNTNLGRLDAMEPERIAEGVVRSVGEALGGGGFSGSVRILREF